MQLMEANFEQWPKAGAFIPNRKPNAPTAQLGYQKVKPMANEKPQQRVLQEEPSL
jgi:hypothetical protein